MWRIYYDDGTIRSMEQSCPSYGVVCILSSFVDGKGITQYQISSNVPYYIYDGEHWLPAQNNDIIDRLVRGLPIVMLLVGGLTDPVTFRRIHEQAQHDKAALQ